MKIEPSADKGKRALDQYRAALGAQRLSIRISADQLDGGFIAECIDLPGCMSQGDTEQEALDNIAEAITGVLSVRG